MQLIEIENEVLSGQDAFPLSFKTQEKVSGNPSYQLVFQVAEADLDLVSLLGEIIKVRIELPDSAGYRTFFTYVIAGADEGQRQDKFVYSLELSTWTWFLMQNRNCRIFQDLNIIDIIEQVFSKYNFADYRFDIVGNYRLREYCVQLTPVTGPEALPKLTSRPRRFKLSSEASQVLFPTESYTTPTFSPSVSSATR
ncbi:Rhs element Vgr family protein [Yersinia pestis Angola]|nr:Rhs element Vgr family protein [Yersinia pestis Angola]